MKERLDKLLTVKSIVTILLTGVFAVQTLRGANITQEFQTIFVVIIGFYFGTQAAKKEEQK